MVTLRQTLPVFVGFPSGGIGLNVLSNQIEFAFVAHDMIVIIALPQFADWPAVSLSVPIEFLGASRFPAADDCAERTRHTVSKSWS